MRRLFFLLVFFLHALLFAGDPQSFTAPDGTVYQVVKKIGQGNYADVYQVSRERPGQAPELLAIRVEKATALQTIKVNDAAAAKLYAGLSQAPGLLAVGRPQNFTAHYKPEGTAEAKAEQAKIQLMPLATGSVGSDEFKRQFEALRTPSAKPADLIAAMKNATLFTNQSAAAIGDLFGLGLVHGDIKPDNFLYLARPGEVPPFEVLLGDFETVQERGGTPTQRTGTPLYCAPEVFNTSRLGATHTSEARDMYAWAASTYAMIFGDAPVADYLKHHDKNLTNESVTYTTVAQHDKILERVKRRFADLERRLPDRASRRECARIREMVLAGLTFDAGERVRKVQLVNQDSPLVRNAPPPSGRHKVRCLFRRFTGW